MTKAVHLDSEQLQNQLIERDQKIFALNQAVGHLQQQLDWFKRQIFGKKSERIAADLNKAQMVFEGFESLTAQDKEQTQPVSPHKRRNPRRNYHPS